MFDENLLLLYRIIVPSRRVKYDHIQTAIDLLVRRKNQQKGGEEEERNRLDRLRNRDDLIRNQYNKINKFYIKH